MTTQWMRSYRHEGRVVGTYQSADGAAQEMVVLQTLDGIAVEPRHQLMPMDAGSVVRSLALRLEAWLGAAQETGYDDAVIIEALAAALAQRGLVLPPRQETP